MLFNYEQVDDSLSYRYRMGSFFPASPYRGVLPFFLRIIITKKGGAAGGPRHPMSAPTHHPSLCEDGGGSRDRTLLPGISIFRQKKGGTSFILTIVMLQFGAYERNGLDRKTVWKRSG